MATFFNHRAILKFLLENYKFDINDSDFLGRTALDYFEEASTRDYNNKALRDLLVKYGA